MIEPGATFRLLGAPASDEWIRTGDVCRVLYEVASALGRKWALSCAARPYAKPAAFEEDLLNPLRWARVS